MTSDYEKEINVPDSHYKSILDAQSEMIIRYQRDSTITFVNKAYLEFKDGEQQQFIGEKWLDIISPEVAKQTRAMMDAITAENPVARFEGENVRFDGERRWISWVTTGIFDNQGQLADILLVGRDITQRLDLERKLKDSFEEISLLERKFKTVADFTSDMESWETMDGALLYISPSCKRITGFSEDEFFRSPDLLNNLVIPEDKHLWVRRRHMNININSPAEVEFRIRRKDGQVRWMHSIGGLISDDKGIPTSVRSSTRDITERKNIELELEQANRSLMILNEKYNTITEYTFNMERWVLPDGTLSYISPSCERLTGYTREEFMAEPGLFENIIKMGDQKLWNNIITELKPGDTIPEVEVRIRHKEGQIYWISTSLSGVVSPRGKYIGIRTSSHDITKKKNAEIALKMAFEEIKEMQEKLEQENLYLRDKVLPLNPVTGFNFTSAAMTEVMNNITQVATTDSPVLIMGETGTGKELIANAIHQQSKRSGRTMIVVNCSALPPSLIESELFGRERGAYTGAIAKQVGRFELADKSTLFLDEIGDLPVDLQVKLLRVLQFGEFQMLGSPHTQKVDVRIIAATNRDLQAAMGNGTFRSDLYFRLNVFPIYVAPLRERKEDIPVLVWSIIEDKMLSMGKRIDKVSKKSMDLLMKYDWPGNIRELQNVVEYSMILSRSTTLEIQMPVQTGIREKENPKTLEESERQHIESVLKLSNGRIRGKGGAAETLGLKESTLRFRMKKLGIR